jgi:hypothetical protein
MSRSVLARTAFSFATASKCGVHCSCCGRKLTLLGGERPQPPLRPGTAPPLSARAGRFGAHPRRLYSPHAKQTIRAAAQRSPRLRQGHARVLCRREPHQARRDRCPPAPCPQGVQSAKGKEAAAFRRACDVSAYEEPPMIQSRPKGEAETGERAL